MTMFDLEVLERMETGLGALASRHPVPGLTRDLPATHEAPDQVRGGLPDQVWDGVCPVNLRQVQLQGEAA